MKKRILSSTMLVLLSGCATFSDTVSQDVETQTVEATAEQVSSNATDLSDGLVHTLSAELMTHQGGTMAARDYVVMQAKRACDSLGKELYIDKLTSETTWRGGRADLAFACVEKNDPRLKSE